MNPETLKAMKEAAAKAMPGPWGWTYHRERDYGVIALESEAANADVLLCTGDSDRSWGDISEADADFIAKANPTNVSALIAEVERLRASRRVYELDNHHNALACGYCSGPLRDELVRLQTEVERQAREIEELKEKLNAGRS